MRILVINYEYPPLGGGAATFTRYLVENLARKGYQLRVLTSRFADLPAYERVNDKLEIYRVTSWRKSICEGTIKGMLSFMAAGWWGLDRLVEGFAPAVCLNFFGIPGGPLALYAKKKYNLPYVLCLRGGDVPGFSPQETGFYHQLLAPLNRAIWSGAAGITANSEGLRQLANEFAPTANIKVIYNGVATELFRPLGQPARDEYWNVLYVGRMTHQKNLEMMFTKLIPRIIAADPRGNIRFTLVGDGPLKEKLVALARQHNYHERVTFLPWVGRQELPALYNGADLFLLPSLYEGMSNVALEAKACGLPLAGFDIAGNREIFEPGRDLMVGVGEGNLLADQIAGLAQAGGGGGGAVSSVFQEKFGMSAIAEQYENILHEAVARGN